MADILLTVFFGVAGLTIGATILFYVLVVMPKRKFELSGALDTVLYRVLLPKNEHTESGEAKQKEPKEIMAAMEQFYSSLEPLRTTPWHDMRFGASTITFEVALPHVGEEVVFYASMPRRFSSYFANQLNSFMPSAKVEETNDYNIFHPTGTTGGSILKLKKNNLLSLKTYNELSKDPLEAITGAFAKLKHTGDGASIQFVMRPARSARNVEGKRVGQDLRRGKSLKEALGGTKQELKQLAKSPKKASDNPEPNKPFDENLVHQIEGKASYNPFDVNIRILVSAETPEETGTILQGLESAFSQFDNPEGNQFGFIRVGGKALEELVYNFSFRLFKNSNSLYTSAQELATLFHFPYSGFAQTNVQYLKSREAPAPVELAGQGLKIGESTFRGTQKNVYITEDDRRRHMYVIGQTGTGKSTLLKEMARQDIQAGRGVCFIDPHGQDVEDLLATVPKERFDDVIYFNPADVERPMGLNFLEYDMRYPEQKTTIVNELLDIFNKLYNMSVAGGPMFEQYFRNATMLVMQDPQSGNTLLEVQRVLVDEEFRKYKLSRSSNVVVNTFWEKIATKAGGEASLQNMVPYITSKFDTFLSNDIMRPIIAQEHSTIRFREVMDQGKILLINLSKGRLGELNAALLGHIIVGKILIGALSRADIAEAARRDFYCYIDEFQNVTTKSISTILSEARKYRLNLVIAHQFLGQLDDDIRKAVFGNVGTMIAFRVGSEDGEFMEKQFEPVFHAQDLMNINNRNAYVKLLINGQTSKAFNIIIPKPEDGNKAQREEIIEGSRKKYGSNRAEVEADITKRYKHG
ncbi:MAG: type IV secretion system DNA-binding domain-containing protein [bacterium]|nr:type IV secretion system DNA-binding domain-containing protein [bacterium]